MFLSDILYNQNAMFYFMEVSVEPIPVLSFVFIDNTPSPPPCPPHLPSPPLDFKILHTYHKLDFVQLDFFLSMASSQGTYTDDNIRLLRKWIHWNKMGVSGYGKILHTFLARGTIGESLYQEDYELLVPHFLRNNQVDD